MAEDLGDCVGRDSRGQVWVSGPILARKVSLAFLRQRGILELRGMSEDIRDAVLEALKNGLSTGLEYEPFFIYDFERRRHEYGIKVSKKER